MRDVGDQLQEDPEEVRQVMQQIRKLLKRESKSIQKKSDPEFYKKFHNLKMLNKLSGGLFDMSYPLPRF
jgi:hypothetical protein